MTSTKPQTPNCSSTILCGILLRVKEDPIVEIMMTLPVKEMRKIRNRNSPAITLVERVYVGDGGGPATGTRVPFSSKTKVI